MQLRSIGAGAGRLAASEGRAREDRQRDEGPRAGSWPQVPTPLQLQLLLANE